MYPKDLAKLEIVLPPPEIQDEIAQLNKEAETEFIKLIRRANDDLAANRELIKAMILTGENNHVESSEIVDESIDEEQVA